MRPFTGIALALGALALVGCAQSPRLEGSATDLVPEVSAAPLLPGSGPARGDEPPARPRSPNAPLGDGDRRTLLHVSQQEKLARDFYSSLSETWRLDVFHTTSGSEDIHADALRTLLGRYKLPDPAYGLARGEFNRVDLTERYDDLIARGRFSAVEALKAAASVEELEIEDISERLPRVQSPELSNVLESVVASDKHHLRSLVVALRRLGHTYSPTRLPREQFDLILGEQALNR
ncbi:MAG: DUF2202 domain-containing protein [Polyangiaceae bacterium]